MPGVDERSCIATPQRPMHTGGMDWKTLANSGFGNDVSAVAAPHTTTRASALTADWDPLAVGGFPDSWGDWNWRCRKPGTPAAVAPQASVSTAAGDYLITGSG